MCDAGNGGFMKAYADDPVSIDSGVELSVSAMDDATFPAGHA